VLEAGYENVDAETIKGRVVIEYAGKAVTVAVEGNGRLDCVNSAIKQVTGKDYILENYVEHALEEKSTSQAASYIGISENGKVYWGAGIHTDIMTSSVKALVSAVNRML
jgi:2-isopropylmalate synthase